MMDKPLNVLLVEDDRNFGFIVTKFLARARRVQFSVEQAFTLKEGIEKISSGSYNLVLLDLTLPDSRGMESVNLVLETNSRLPIIVLTGEDETLALKALHLGVQDYIQKGDFDLRSLERIILHGLERHELMVRLETQRDLLDLRAAELEISNASFASLGYTLAHDLSEPLRTVSSYLDLLRKRALDRLTEKDLDYLDMAREGSARMTLLITDLYAYSQISRIKKFVTVDLNVILAEVSKNLRKAIVESHADVFIGALGKARGNRSQLVMLFQNLIANSLRYKNPDVNPIIKIEAVQNQSECVISVVDNGIGIDSNFFLEIFEPFRRLHPLDEYAGSGIGLASCRKIVEHHGGKIWVESKVGSGSTFFVALPVAEPTASDDVQN